MFALTGIESRLALREPVNLMLTVAFPLMLLVVLLAVFGNQPDDAFGGIGGTDYYVPAYVAASITAYGLIAVPVHLASYKEQGTLKRLNASGVGTGAVLVAQGVVMAVVATVGAVLMSGVGVLAYDLSLPVDLGGVLVGFAVGVAAFAALGVALAALMPGARAAQSVGLFLFFGMFFIAGGGPPREILPDWLGTLGDWLPMSYVVSAIRDPWTTGDWDWAALAVLIGFLAIGALTALRLRSD